MLGKVKFLKIFLTHENFLFSKNYRVKQIVESGLVGERLIHFFGEFEAEIAFWRSAKKTLETITALILDEPRSVLEELQVLLSLCFLKIFFRFEIILKT